MKTCKMCKHWTQPLDGDFQVKNDFRYCKSPKVVFGRRMDVAPEYVDTVMIDYDDDSEKPLTPDMGAVLDGSGYFACLTTGPEFGCIHHEEIPK